ncbi:hypothetical protein E7X23_22975 [Bacteroides fragilis]|nr:hypothetical protein E7X23_22975 [Bacteroides fragilis]
MKIGILTFHDAHNYGAMLQCYALQQFLFKKGYNVEVIDYRPAFYQSNTIVTVYARWIGKIQYAHEEYLLWITHQDLLKNRFYMILLTLKKRFT